MHQITLNSPSARTEILVGENLSRKLETIDPAPVLLVDEQVLYEHRALFQAYTCISVPSGEKFKNLHVVERIYRKLIDLEADRSTMLVGVGGGLATDLAGFVASTYLRGVSFGFISSTLLGQVDASIGGKNGVNLDGYKNMIGNIRQPSFVWCDLSLLRTLAREEYISGIAEVIKYGAIWDVKFLDYLDEQMPGLLNLDMEVLQHVVSVSAKIKVDVVQQDEHESDLRRILNFGHTFGHAIEREQKVLHGQAVSMGMLLAARLSRKLGLLGDAEVEQIRELLVSAGLPVQMHLDPEVVFQTMRKDKKKSGDRIHLILLEGLGHARIHPMNLPELKSLIHDLC